MVTFFVLEVPDNESAMLIYFIYIYIILVTKAPICIVGQDYDTNKNTVASDFGTTGFLHGNECK